MGLGLYKQTQLRHNHSHVRDAGLVMKIMCEKDLTKRHALNCFQKELFNVLCHKSMYAETDRITKLT